jgi:TPR repeat protein
MLPASIVDEMRKKGSVSGISQFRDRALQGDNASLIALGYIYFRRKNYGEALFWFEKVKLENDITGFVASHLATIYYKGLGITKNHRIAAKYLRSAALRGRVESRVLFAILQKKGDGTLKKLRAAETMLRASVCDPKLSVRMRFLALVWLYP